MNKLLLFVFFFLAYTYVSANSIVDSLSIENDRMDSSVNEYWKSKYYDSIAKQKVVEMPTSQSYEEMIERYQSKDFEYVESISKKLDFLSQFFIRLFKFIEDLFPKSNIEINDGVLAFLAICAIVIALVLIYKYFISNNKLFVTDPEEDEGEESELSFVEKNLMQLDVNLYIDEAVKNKNYSLAIRYQQLLNIQLLQRKGFVTWHSAKTNLELIETVVNEKLKKDFMDCSKIFDYVWFGEFQATESDYQSYLIIFEEFRRRWA